MLNMHGEEDRSLDAPVSESLSFNPGPEPSAQPSQELTKGCGDPEVRKVNLRLRQRPWGLEDDP